MANGFFLFQRKYIYNKSWSSLSNAGRSAFPVILRYMNSSGLAFPSQQTIADVTGISRKTANKGVCNIKSTILTFLSRKKQASSGNLACNYQLLKHSTHNSFSLQRSIFDDGKWAALNNPAKSIYIVMRCTAIPSIKDTDFNFESKEDFNKCYQERTFDFIKETNQSILSRMSGTHRSSLKSGINCLKENKLIDEDTLKIYLS